MKCFFKVNLALWEAKKAVSVEQDAVRFGNFLAFLVAHTLPQSFELSA